jgi:hypothetical protein
MSKKSFKVVLNSLNIDSFTGTELNANYFIDLKNVIRNKEDYEKSYYVYCTFITDTDRSALIGLTSTNIYTLTLNFTNKCSNIYQYDNNNLISFGLPIQINPSDNGAGAPHIGLILQDKDQRPLYIENLYNINNITLKVLENDVISTSDISYVCILTFVEC